MSIGFALFMLNALLLLLSLLFKVAGKLRLAVPLVYALLMGTVFLRWQAENETLAYTIFYVLIGLAVLSWLVPLFRRIGEWRYSKQEQKRIFARIQELRELGYSSEEFYIDTSYGIPVVRLYEDEQA